MKRKNPFSKFPIKKISEAQQAELGRQLVRMLWMEFPQFFDDPEYDNPVSGADLVMEIESVVVDFFRTDKRGAK